MLKFPAIPNRCIRSAFLLLAIAGVSPAGFADGQTPVQEHKDVPVVSDVAEQKIIDHMLEANLGRLKGWPGMIFYCASEDSKVPALKQICLETNKTLENLAVQHKVNFHKARNSNDVALLPHLTGRAKVLIELTATEPGTDPSAISAHIAVYAHYAHAVNRATELPQQQDSNLPKHPTLVPQHVDAILWESTVIKAGAGSTDQLAQPVTRAIADKLGAFFADYDKANR